MKGTKMDNCMKHFVRDSSGAWECVSPAELAGPNGRIQVTPGLRVTKGTTFMGVDLAKWLDEQYESGSHTSMAHQNASVPVQGSEAARP